MKLKSSSIIFLFIAMSAVLGCSLSSTNLYGLGRKYIPNSEIPVVSYNAEWKPITKNFDGIDMVLVPPGCFLMGGEDLYNTALPIHNQCIEKSFWIDKTEVTNKQFEVYGGKAKSTGHWTEDNRPRETVTWFEARDFCLKRGGRLPNEVEWEYAAAGPDSLVYPWGNDFIQANVVSGGYFGDHTSDVGSRPEGASWVGALDMSGNVWEWIANKDHLYPYQDGGISEYLSDDTLDRGIRGGNWGTDRKSASTFARQFVKPTEGYLLVGFRCIREL
jgi:formylglycine-generating enzyme required for sulfatase activity